MAFETLIVIDRGPARIITVNRPETLNALDKKTLAELESAFAEVESHAEVRAVILTGAGEKAFVAGADIGEMKGIAPAEAEEMSRLGHRVMERIERLPMPVIAAVNGFALGGGLELALACDFIYASESAQLGLPETSLGLIPGFGGTSRLPRRVGVALAREMIFAARRLKAHDALRVGLVNQVVPDGEVVEAAVKTAEAIAKNGPYAVALAKRLLLDNQDVHPAAANLSEQSAFGLVFGTKDRDEGVAAFLEKRKPSFEGR